MYIGGKGVQRDYHKAMEYLLKAANQGNSNAQFNVGIPFFFFQCFIIYMFTREYV